MFPLNLKYDRVCRYCNSNFVAGAPNALTCHECSLNGHTNTCIHCLKKFLTTNRKSKYCSSCSSTKVYLIGKKRSPKEVEAINLGREKWLRSESAKEFYKKLGEDNSKNLKKHFKTDKGIAQILSSAKKQSNTMRLKIRKGEFTPNITNSWTRWTAKFSMNGIVYKFRSSWEACFWISNSHCEYETIRVPSISNPDQIYIGDFFDNTLKTLYEIKPKSEFLKKKDKMDSLLRYCKENKIRFIWLNESNITNFIDEKDFDTDEKKIQLVKMKKGIGNESSKTKNKKNRKNKKYRKGI